MPDPGWNTEPRHLAGSLLKAMQPGDVSATGNGSGDPAYDLPERDRLAIRSLTGNLGPRDNELLQRVLAWLARVGSWLRLLPPDIALWWPRFVKLALEALRQASPATTPLHSDDTAPTGFPRVPGYRADVESFEGGHGFYSLWHAVPWTAQQIVEIVEWARDAGYRVRPRGATHSWAPTTPIAEKVVLLDMRRFDIIDLRRLAREHLASFGTAVTIERISEELRDAGYMLAFTPAIGFATLGGTMATGAHGKGTDVLAGGGATICSQVVEIQAVAFNPESNRYELRQFGVDDPELPALSLHLGSAIVTRVTVRAIEKTLFQVSKGYFSLPRYFDDAGGTKTLREDLTACVPIAVELMWFPYQGRFGSRRHLLRRGLQATTEGKPSLQGQQPYRETFNFAARDVDRAFAAALKQGRRRDIGIKFQHLLGFGRSDNQVVDAHAGRIYVSHFILRMHAAGWCVVVDRDRIGSFLLRFADTVRALQEQRKFPLDGPIEIRITDVEPLERGPALSPAAAPRATEPRTVYAVWLNVLTYIDCRAGLLLRELEAFLLQLRLADGVHRVCGEWHKGWAYDDKGRPWADAARIGQFRDSFDCTSQRWRDAQAVLEGLDPHAVFRSELAETLFEP